MADSRHGDRERPAYRRSDSIFDDDRQDRHSRGEGRGSSSEGGFLQRAGEEVRSWFSDDDERGQSRGQSQGSRSDYGAYQGGRSGADQRETWGGGSDGAGGRGSQGSGGSSTFDDHYLSWRERQIRQLDQDYEEYCRDRQKQFESDFHGWRQSRPGQNASQGASQSGGTPDQTGVASGRTGMEGQRAGSGATTGMSDDRESGSAGESSAAATAGGGGEGSATESSTGSSATSGSGARTSRKSQDGK